MEIIVNQQATTVADSCSLQQMLDTVLPRQQQGIAVAINQTIIPKTRWAAHQLQPHDNIMLIRATQGG